MGSNVGYEVGQPAYPDPTEDKSHQMPLSEDKLSAILSKTQPQHPGGFFWEMYKGDDGQATATEVAQKLCKAVLGDAPRCSGVIPTISPSPTPTPSPSGDMFRCSNDQCVSSGSGGVSKEVCESICGAAKYKCVHDQCVATSDGVVDEATCNSICGSSIVL